MWASNSVLASFIMTCVPHRQVAGAQKHRVDGRLSQKGHDIRLLAALGDHLLKPMIGSVDDKGTEVSLGDALVSDAAAAFLFLVIFWELGSKFIPPQLYQDLQSSMKNVYVVVARQLQDPKTRARPACCSSSWGWTRWRSSSARCAAAPLA